MEQDEIIREVRAVRENLAARHNYDIRALLKEAQRRERDSDHKLIHLEPKQLNDETKRSA